MHRKRVLNKVAQNGGGPPRPDVPEAGRGEARTEEEINDFMSTCVQNRWGEGQAGRVADYLGVRADTENKMKIAEVICCGIIAKPITAQQTRREILDVWRDSEERQALIEEDF